MVIKIGNLVKLSDPDEYNPEVGVIIDTDINVWGEEAVPTGVEVYWPDGSIDVIYQDEIELVV